MKTWSLSMLALAGILGGCAPDTQRSAERVRQEEREGAQEVGRAERKVREEAGEAQKEIGEAKRDLVEDLKQAEKSGKPVEFDAQVVSTTPTGLSVRLPGGENVDIEYGPGSRFMRGGATVAVTDLRPGTPVHVTYRVQNGKRFADEVDVVETTTPPAPTTPGTGTR